MLASRRRTGVWLASTKIHLASLEAKYGWQKVAKMTENVEI